MLTNLPENTKAERAFKKMVIQMRTQNRSLKEMIELAKSKKEMEEKRLNKPQGDGTFT